MFATNLQIRGLWYFDYRKLQAFNFVFSLFILIQLHCGSFLRWHLSFTCRYEDEPSGKTYNAKVALQLCIRPDSYNVGPQTIGATSEIDPKFNNQEIEWFTKERGSTIPYGLLVKLYDGAA